MTLSKLLPRRREADSYLRLIDSCITRVKAQGRSRNCNKSKEEQEKGAEPVREEEENDLFEDRAFLETDQMLLLEHHFLLVLHHTVASQFKTGLWVEAISKFDHGFKT